MRTLLGPLFFLAVLFASACGGESDNAEFASASGSVGGTSLPVSWGLATNGHGLLNIALGSRANYTCSTLASGTLFANAGILALYTPPSTGM